MRLVKNQTMQRSHFKFMIINLEVALNPASNHTIFPKSFYYPSLSGGISYLYLCPQTSNTYSPPIFILCWWPCFLFHWVRRELPQTPTTCISAQVLGFFTMAGLPLISLVPPWSSLLVLFKSLTSKTWGIPKFIPWTSSLYFLHLLISWFHLVLWSLIWSNICCVQPAFLPWTPDSHIQLPP